MTPATAQESRSFIRVGRENTNPIDIYYEDQGSGKPVVLIHGWPLSGASWEKETAALLAAGHRVITYDRRGFGKSSQPSAGYEYDTFAADLNQLMTTLDLREATLAGFSMGGGEVARYLGTYGAERVARAVFFSSVPPFLLKTADNPGGIEQSVFDGIQKGLRDDRPAFLAQFLANFYNVDVLGGKRISDEAVKNSWTVAIGASPKGTHDCVKAWYTDFRKDLAKIQVPTLVMHGEQDRIVPIGVSGALTHAAIRGSKFVPVKDAPHGLLWTHAEEVIRELLAFLR